jgi:hypothetical protein
MDLISAFSGARNSIVIPRPYILLIQEYDRQARAEAGRETGEVAPDWESAYILSQLVFWSFKRSNTPHKGWFYKTDEDLKKEAGITQSQVNRVKKKLQCVGLETSRKKVNPESSTQGAKTHYRINWDVFYPLLRSAIEREYGEIEQPPVVSDVSVSDEKPKRGARKKSADQGKENDPVEVWRGYVGRYLPKQWHEEVRRDVTDIERLKLTLRFASEKGWNLMNVSNILRSYRSGEALPQHDRQQSSTTQDNQAVGGAGVFVNSEWQRQQMKRLGGGVA